MSVDDIPLFLAITEWSSATFANDEEGWRYHVTIEVAGAGASRIAGIVDHDVRGAVVGVRVTSDGLGLDQTLAARLLAMTCDSLSRDLGDDATAVEIYEPDGRGWLAHRLYQHDTARIARRMQPFVDHSLVVKRGGVLTY